MLVPDKVFAMFQLHVFGVLVGLLWAKKEKTKTKTKWEKRCV